MDLFLGVQPIAIPEFHDPCNQYSLGVSWKPLGRR
jgi:hypothetical protein